WKLDIHEDQVRVMLSRKVERLDPTAGADGVVAMGLQKVVEELHIELVVFHDHDGLGHLPRPFGICRTPKAALAATDRPSSVNLVPICYGKANTEWLTTP